jgi:hypothetical protein
MSGWLPPFLLGAATAVVLETGLGLLLFVSPGLLPALTGILFVALGSFAAGLASVRTGAVASSGLRWRWLLATASLVGAAVLSLDWTFQDGGLPETSLGRGAQLAFILALPLYALGACLAAVVQEGARGRAGATATVGGAMGVAILGLILFPRFEPFSVYLFCVMCVATAALGLPRTPRAGTGRPPTSAGERDPWALNTLDS